MFIDFLYYNIDIILRGNSRRGEFFSLYVKNPNKYKEHERNIDT